MKAFKSMKKLRRFSAVCGLILVMLLVSIPLVSALDFHVSLMIGDSSFVDAVYTQIGSDSPVGYHTGDTIVYTDLEFGFQIKATLNNDGKLAGYNGFFVSLTRQQDSIGNEIKSYVAADALTEVHLANGTTQYFIGNDLYFRWAVSTPTTFVLTFTPVYFTESDGMVGGYSAGYQAGYIAASTEYSGVVAEKQATIDSLTAALQDATDFDLDLYGKQQYNQGLADAASTQTFVQDVVSTGVNGFGDIVLQFLRLKVIGIPVYGILLVVTIIPLAIAVLKLVTHRG